MSRFPLVVQKVCDQVDDVSNSWHWCQEDYFSPGSLPGGRRCRLAETFIPPEAVVTEGIEKMRAIGTERYLGVTAPVAPYVASGISGVGDP